MELAKADMGKTSGDARTKLGPVLARLADAHGGPACTVAADLPPDLPPLAMEDGALETVLATLFENARQAGASQLTITAQVNRTAARIALKDNGPGVPEADRFQIFDPFFTSKREAGGTGLGLPIARALAVGCGGELELVENGTGACFVLTLPVNP